MGHSAGDIDVGRAAVTGLHRQANACTPLIVVLLLPMISRIPSVTGTLVTGNCRAGVVAEDRVGPGAVGNDTAAPVARNIPIAKPRRAFQVGVLATSIAVVL